ncbi:MAG: hypothetical protein GC168_10220 [Candidatus Hydrogenedens sp.]|nr:hypothetical protein [Candidatus Hydrogenedens sp.]
MATESISATVCALAQDAEDRRYREHRAKSDEWCNEWLSRIAFHVELLLREKTGSPDLDGLAQYDVSADDIAILKARKFNGRCLNIATITQLANAFTAGSPEDFLDGALAAFPMKADEVARLETSIRDGISEIDRDIAALYEKTGGQL